MKKILCKIIIENLWNSLIVKKFIKDVKIDEESIKKEINEMEFQSEYNLSELVFELSDKENVNSKYEIILDKINNESLKMQLYYLVYLKLLKQVVPLAGLRKVH